MLWLWPVATCLLILMTASAILACYAVHRAIEAQIEVKALKNSTHQIQFVPAEGFTSSDKEDEQMSKQLDKDEVLAWDALRDVSEPLS